jgi:hypothetical protein
MPDGQGPIATLIEVGGRQTEKSVGDRIDRTESGEPWQPRWASLHNLKRRKRREGAGHVFVNELLEATKPS